MNVYERLGVRPVINATCHWTVYGGSVEWPEVLQAMEEASRTCVDMRQLLDRASDIICQYTHAEAATVVSGCAAGLEIGAAAILTGDNRELQQQLPNTTGMKNQFVCQRHPRVKATDGHEYANWGYAHAVRCAGGEFVEVDDTQPDALAAFDAAFGSQTAGVYWVSDGDDNKITLQDVIRIAHKHGVPVLVDASNTLPPAEHLHSFIDMGADLVSFSGGKGLRGPQGSGILTGRGDLIRAARMQSAPIQGVGRPMKCSKEEIVGLVTALEVWAKLDHAAELDRAKKQTQLVVDQLQGIPGVRAELKFPDHVGRPYPTAFVHLDKASGLTAEKVGELLLKGEPSIAVMAVGNPQLVRVDVRVLADDEVRHVARRLHEVLARQPATVR